MIAAIHGILEQGQGWSPKELSGLVHYLNADMGVSKDGSNGVDSWRDQSASLTLWNNITTGGKPLYQPTGFNGKPGIKFTPNATIANTTRLQRNLNLTIGKAYTIFELANITTIGATLAGGSYSEGGYFINADANGTYTAAGSGYALWNTVTAAAHTGSAKIRHVIRNGTSAELFIEGTSQGVKTMTANNDLMVYTVGSMFRGDTGIDGIIRIQLAYNRVLTSNEIAQVYSFLQANK